MLSSAGSQIDHVVGRSHDIEVVLNANDGVSLTNEGIKSGEELGHIVKVKAGGRFVKKK